MLGGYSGRAQVATGPTANFLYMYCASLTSLKCRTDLYTHFIHLVSIIKNVQLL